MTYEVSTPVFAGPFDLLLHLILREQVDLYEVSLTAIVDAYVAELARLEEVDLEIATEFLLIAATLVDMKARSLLPDESDLDLDDELAMWEERDLLLARLVECKTFKDASVVLEGLAGQAGRCFPRLVGIDERFIDLTPDLLAGVAPDDLRDAFIRTASPKPVPTIDLFHVAPIRISVTDAVAELAQELPTMGQVSFRRLTSHIADRIEVIVHFLAVLEMYKQGMVDVTQASSFGSIELVWAGEASDEDGSVWEPDWAAVDSYEG